MYIPTWIIIAVVIAGMYFYFQYKRQSDKSTISDGESLTIEEMWERADTNMAKVLLKSPNLEDYLQEERDMVRVMERDMIRLRERFRHDAKRQLEIARDWMDYSGAVERIKFSREWLDVDIEDTAYDSHDERTKKAYITVKEIEKRVGEILGKDSSSKLVHDRLEKKAEVANEIINK